jgi:hypothetical protein
VGRKLLEKAVVEKKTQLVRIVGAAGKVEKSGEASKCSSTGYFPQV